MAGLLRWNGFKNGLGEIMNGGTAITIIFLVIVSVMALANAG